MTRPVDLVHPQDVIDLLGPPSALAVAACLELLWRDADHESRRDGSSPWERRVWRIRGDAFIGALDALEADNPGTWAAAIELADGIGHHLARATERDP